MCSVKCPQIWQTLCWESAWYIEFVWVYHVCESKSELITQLSDVGSHICCCCSNERCHPLAGPEKMDTDPITQLVVNPRNRDNSTFLVCWMSDEWMVPLMNELERNKRENEGGMKENTFIYNSCKIIIMYFWCLLKAPDTHERTEVLFHHLTLAVRRMYVCNSQHLHMLVVPMAVRNGSWETRDCAFTNQYNRAESFPHIFSKLCFTPETVSVCLQLFL